MQNCETLKVLNVGLFILYKIRLPFESLCLFMGTILVEGNITCFVLGVSSLCESRWPRGLSHASATTGLLGLRVRIPPGTCLSLVSVVCPVR